jgi:hypothetical protein
MFARLAADRQNRKADQKMTTTTTRVQGAFLWVAPVTLSAVFVAILMVGRGWNAIPLGVPIILILLVAWCWYSYLAIPRSVRLEGEFLVCERPTGRLSIAIGDIQKIDARKWNRGFVKVVAGNRSIYFLRNMPGLLQLLARVSDDRPGIAVRGQLPDTAA